MRQLVIGIDYGTSNSGVAYALFDDNDDLTPGNVDISVIKDLARGKFGQDSLDKIPSQIAYDSDWQPIGHGFDIPETANALQWVKLLLEPSGLRGKRNIQRVWDTYEVLGTHKRPVDVVADYLSWIWRLSKASIIKELDEPDLFADVSLTVVLTVPASWSERGKQNILKAATTAGITEEAQTIKLIPEAEAAAIFGLKRQAQRTAVAAIAEGDCVVVCDAGGGTVDVVAYQVRSRNPLSIDQRTGSKGAFCGSVFIDLEFQNQLRSILGEGYEAMDNETRTRIDEKFEYNIKRSYHPQTSDSPKEYSIPLSQNEETTIEAEAVEQSFQAVMTPIETLIEKQINQLRKDGLEEKLKGILLVGGLSRSEYIYARIHDGYADQRMKVWRSDDAWTAVAQGAVYCETTAVIHSRLSKHNYGILYRSDDRRYVHWIVRKGQSVKSNMATEPYAMRIDDQPWLSEDKFFWLSVTLVRSDDDDATEEFNARSVKPHAVIDCRFPTNIRFSKVASLVQEDPKAWHVPARLVPILDGAVISFRCKVDKEEVGVTEVGCFDNEAPSDQDFHPAHADGTSINPAPRSNSVQENDRILRQVPTSSSGGRSIGSKIKDYHFNTRVTRDTPPEQRPRPGTLPGLFARGWIPRADFYVDHEPET